MPESNPTFEEIDRQIQALDLNAIKGGRGTTQEKICSVYRGIRPILQILVNLPLPPKWHDALKTLMELLDTLCPTR